LNIIWKLPARQCQAMAGGEFGYWLLLDK